MSDIEEKYENLLRFLGISECYRCSGTGLSRQPYLSDCPRCNGDGYVRHGYRDLNVRHCTPARPAVDSPLAVA